MIHVISHTHWDREWFVPAGFARAWLVPFFDSLFKLLREEPEYRFVLDGQSILLEDYLLQLSPEEQEEAAEAIARYAGGGRLVLGPYYQQPDWQLVSGEALVRNLLIGSGDARSLAGESRSRVGWLMDNFGQIGQAVQIHRAFGIRGLYAWRGFDLLPRSVSDAFRWESPDGSSLPVVYLLDSYRNGMRLFAAPEFTQRRLAAAAERIAPFSSDGNLLLMNGYDQEMEPENIPGELARLPGDRRKEITVSDPEKYLESKRIEGPTLKGAQRSGRFISVFPGILSARIYLKIANSRAESAMRRYLDPLIAMATIHGPENADSKELRRESDLIWRLILQNHPHDTICGVSSDPVHEETELRLSQIEKRQQALLQRLAALLPLKAPGPASAPGGVYFNPSLYPRPALVIGDNGEESISEAIPPLTAALLGGGTRSSAAGEQSHAPGGGTHAPGGGTPAPALAEDEGSYRLSNGLITARIGDDGSLALRHEESGVSFDNLLGFRDSGDAGDTYSEERLEAGSREGISRLTANKLWRTPARVVVELSGTLELPAGLSMSRSERSSETVSSEVRLRLELRKGESFVRIKITLFNRSRDHRLQLRFSTSRPEGRVVSFTQFAWEDPAAELPQGPGDSEAPPEVRRLMLGAREPELSPIFPTAGAVAGGDEGGALLVAQEGLFEGELLGGSDFGLTLLRSVGWLARGDLSSRTGDAGPEIFAPEAQCLRPMEARLAVAPLPSLEEAGGPGGTRIIEEFSAPLVRLPSRPEALGAGAKEQQSMEAVSLLPEPARTARIDALQLSTVKLPESQTPERSVILRLYNPWKERVGVPHFLTQGARRVLLDEETREEAREPGVLEPFQIATFLVSWEGAAAEGSSPGAEVEQPWQERFGAALDGELVYHRFGRRAFRLPADAWSWLFGQGESPRGGGAPESLTPGGPPPAGPGPGGSPSDGAPVGGELSDDEVQASGHQMPTARAEDRRRWLDYVADGVSREEERLKRLERREAEAAENYGAARKEDPEMRRRETIIARSAQSTYHRQRLEAELSLTFARWTLRRLNGEPSAEEQRKLYRQIEKLALELNHARVAKRADDYLAALEEED